MATTTTNLADLWNEYLAAEAEHTAAGLPETSPALQRLLAANAAIAAARPSDPRDMAFQLRRLVELGHCCDEAEVPVLLHIAQRLEAMAPDA